MSNTSNSKKVIIIGAGISGLATAALCAKAGYKTTILEKNSYLGGRASIYSDGGFIFDKGPSWYMMPKIFDDYFALFNKKASDYYNLKQLDVHYKVFFDSKDTYTITKNSKANAYLFEQVEQGASKQLIKYLDESKFLYNMAMKDLVMFDYTSFSQILKPQLLHNLFRLRLLSNLHQYVSKYFKHKDLQKILEFTTVFLGGSPYNTPAFYSLLAHADFNLGIYYPMGGMHEIVKALVLLCQEYKVAILKNQEVINTVFKDNQIIKVKTKHRSFDLDLLVSSMDYRNFEVTMLPYQNQTYSKQYWDKKTYSPGAFIIYVGINKKLKNVEHHNLYFHQSWEHHFDTVFSSKQWPKNPSYYVHVPSKTDPSVAPSYGESLMFLVPVAPGLEDNKKVKNDFAQKIISHFETIIDEKITPYIKVKKIFAHQDFIDEYNTYLGSAFGLAHTLLQNAIFRPKNKSKKVQNLYYVGQYTNPGVGVPMQLLSAQIVTKLIKKNF